MNIKKNIFSRSLCLALSILLLSGSVPVYATESGELKEKVDDLTSQTAALKQELDDTSAQVDTLASQIEATKLELTAAKLSEQQQYDAMKSRIKFMYEGGDYNLLETLLSSKSMGDFLANAEYITTITEYDRKMLNELQATSKDVEAKSTKLSSQQGKLATLQQTLQTKVDDTQKSLDDYQAQYKDAVAKEEAARKAAEAAKAAKLEEARQAAEKAKQASESAQNDKVSTGTTTGGSEPVSVNSDELVLFAAILEAEAGTGYDNCLAVATVIMNRVESSRYPNSVQGVIYQKGQFSPTWNGALNRVFNRGVNSTCVQVARDALAGARHSAVRNCYQFRMVGYASGITIGDNTFF